MSELVSLALASASASMSASLAAASAVVSAFPPLVASSCMRVRSQIQQPIAPPTFPYAGGLVKQPSSSGASTTSYHQDVAQHPRLSSLLGLTTSSRGVTMRGTTWLAVACGFALLGCPIGKDDASG